MSFSSGGSDGNNIELEPTDNKLTPKLVQIVDQNGNTVRREFNPQVVTRLGGTLPWETESMQLQCGETITTNNGDQNLRLVFKCIASHSEFQTLQQMRTAPTGIKLISGAYTGPVSFDELKFDEIPDSNGAVVRGEGQTDEKFYEVQLQSKEEDGNNSVIGDGE